MDSGRFSRLRKLKEGEDGSKESRFEWLREKLMKRGEKGWLENVETKREYSGSR